MEGDLSDVQEHGVIPRSAAAIFDALKKDPDYVSSTVYCSLLEIYNEELSDLLIDNRSSNKRGMSSSKATAAGTTKLAIMEGENGPFCRGLSESKVKSAGDLLGLMKIAHNQRMTGETDMNKESSRSHCIFTLRVVAKRKLIDGSILEVGGKLHCVDLAGSECAKSCGNAGKQQAARERERMNINRSLLTLGRVVKLLKEKSEKPLSANSVRIPYRDSKLTRILQESLGGRCKTCLIATISPSVTAIEESMSTLNYAQAANGIINKPITTSLMSVGGFDNKSPRGEGASGAGVEHWHEMECRLEYMQSQVDEAQQALARKHIQHQEYVERAEKAELAQELAERKFEKATHDISVLENKVEDVTQLCEASEKMLRETKVILGATQRTEVCLTKEATALLEVLKTTITDGDRMQQALLEKRTEDVDRKTATKDYQNVQTKLLNDLLHNLQDIGQVQKKHRTQLEMANADHKSNQIELLNQHVAVVEGLKRDCVSDIESLRSSLLGGVLPAFRTLTLSSKEKLNALSTILVDGEEILRTQCQLLLDRLAENSNRIAEIESSYDASSKNVLASLATNLEATTQNLTGTAIGFTTALRKASADRKLQRETLKKSIGSFKDRCNGSIDEMGSITHAHTLSLFHSIQKLDDLKGSRARIRHTISNLDGFLEEKKDEYVIRLERQLAILTKQHAALISSNEMQQQMNKAMVSNVMNGMHSLIKNEMKSLDTFQSNNFRLLIESNEESKTCNENLKESTSSTFEHLEHVNTKLDTTIRHNFHWQDKSFKDLDKETSDFDANIRSATDAIRKPVENFSHESTMTLENYDEEDRDTTESIIDTTKTHLDVATNQLASDVEQVVEKGISDLQASTAEGWKYIREEVIDPVRTEVAENIRAHQKQVNASARADISLFETKLDEGEYTVVEEVNNGIEIASAVEMRLEVGASETFAGTINKHKEQIRASQWLESSMETQEQSITNRVSKSSALASSTTENLGGFAHDIILVQEETPEIQERSVPVYSNHLTSTNEPEALLLEAGLCGGNDKSCTNANDENLSKTIVVSQNESSLPPLRDRSCSVNETTAVDVSPPLKRTADKTRSNLPSSIRGSSKRIKTRQR